MEWLVIVTALCFFFLLGYFIGREAEKDSPKYENALTELDWYKTTFLVRIGSTLVNGKMINYSIRSFDGGRHWYEVEPSSDTGFTIVGPADPELIAQRQGWDRLIAHVEAHGPIDFSDLERDVILLQDAGFDVTVKPSITPPADPPAQLP